MTNQIEEASANLSEGSSQPAKLAVLRDADNVAALLSRTALRKSDLVADEEEDEVDRMIQLSGMVYDGMHLRE
ncbi:hypothetical protein SAMN05216386_2005 [Nitrosospira briensis]|uniref:Uncharacterized protein n=1 Tax=Nitrosospira briensis TaxID=35799 RepID=A0A1I5C8A6_9PROT|nr:hypothetical protein [Nitrosospira briensis]SFN83198.1 hypothetical protein SAMN05216386_2005 [Nitrosospira briensis]